MHIAISPDVLARCAVNQALGMMGTGCGVDDDGLISSGRFPLEDPETIILAWVMSDLIVEAVADRADRIGLQVIEGFAEALGIDNPQGRYDDLRREIHAANAPMLTSARLREHYRVAVRIANRQQRKRMFKLGSAAKRAALRTK